MEEVINSSVLGPISFEDFVFFDNDLTASFVCSMSEQELLMIVMMKKKTVRIVVLMII